MKNEFIKLADELSREIAALVEKAFPGNRNTQWRTDGFKELSLPDNFLPADKRKSMSGRHDYR